MAAGNSVQSPCLLLVAQTAFAIKPNGLAVRTYGTTLASTAHTIEIITETCENKDRHVIIPHITGTQVIKNMKHYLMLN